MQMVKTVLSAAGHMVLSKARLDLPGCHCRLPSCSFMNRAIWGGQLYLRITLAGSESLGLTYHLVCLEKLWKGEEFQGPLPDPALYSGEAAVCGRYEELSEAVAGPEVADQWHGRFTHTDLNRTRYLAEFTMPGANLTEREKTLLHSWKQSTQECFASQQTGNGSFRGHTERHELGTRLQRNREDFCGRDLSKVLKL